MVDYWLSMQVQPITGLEMGENLRVRKLIHIIHRKLECVYYIPREIGIQGLIITDGLLECVQRGHGFRAHLVHNLQRNRYRKFRRNFCCDWRGVVSVPPKEYFSVVNNVKTSPRLCWITTWELWVEDMPKKMNEFIFWFCSWPAMIPIVFFFLC